MLHRGSEDIVSRCRSKVTIGICTCTLIRVLHNHVAGTTDDRAAGVLKGFMKAL